MVLAHGAGANMHHRFMAGLSAALLAQNIATLRFNFPYMEMGRRRPDSKKKSTETIERVIQFAEEQVHLPLALGGKSFGGRMASHFAAESIHAKSRSLVFFGFPLHPAGRPAIDRADHLEKIKSPMLFLQGTRDALADLTLLSPIVEAHPTATLQILEGADHGFKYLKKYSIDAQKSLAILAEHAAIFLRQGS